MSQKHRQIDVSKTTIIACLITGSWLVIMVFGLLLPMVVRKLLNSH